MYFNVVVRISVKVLDVDLDNDIYHLFYKTASSLLNQDFGLSTWGKHLNCSTPRGNNKFTFEGLISWKHHIVLMVVLTKALHSFLSALLSLT